MTGRFPEAFFDAQCDVCGELIGESEARLCCARPSCDDVQLCAVCYPQARACPQCGGVETKFVQRAATFKLRDEVLVNADVIPRAFQIYGQRPYLCEPECPDAWWSFEQTGRAASYIGRELLLLKDSAGIGAICMQNSLAWVLVDFALALLHIPSAAIDAALSVIEAHGTAQAAALACPMDELRRVSFLVVDSSRADEWRAAVAALPPDKKSVVVTAAAIMQWALDARQDCSVASDRIAQKSSVPANSWPVTCMFSSGSTGQPKPLWFTAADWPGSWQSLRRAGQGRITASAIFSPLTHALGRRTVWSELLLGGRIGICSTTADCDLRNQIGCLAPTVISAAPRFYQLLQRSFECELALRKSSQKEGNKSVDDVEASVLRSIRSTFGHRLKAVMVGSALVSPHLKQFLWRLFGIGGPGAPCA
jgi:long-subunit acyl-CoA synthetase (AMP-forming)